MNDLLVSIIVPAYNVEKYIGKCINTLLEQSYKNVEIIVINDGSTDGTLNLLKSFDDKRLVIVNQTNSGVSSARNKGLSIANGDYIVFVDGDDFLSEDFVEYFMKLAISHNSDFVFSSKCISSIKWQQGVIDERDISNEEATALLLHPDIIVGCWNKMYKKQFLMENNILFSTHLFYGEGLQFITTVSQMAHNIVFTNAKKYYYRRNNEISATTKFNVRKYINGELALNSVLNGLKLKSRMVLDSFNLHFASFYLGAICGIINSKTKKENRSFYKQWKKQLNYYYKKILFCNSVSFLRKIYLTIGHFCPVTAAMISRKRRKVILENSFE